jgi:hypothetical protein
MFSDSKVLGESADSSDTGYIKKSARVVATKEDGSAPTLKIDGREVNTSDVSDLKWYKAEEGKVELTEVTGSSFERGIVYIATWMHPVASKSIITITPDSFPGTYYVTGDTMIRSERNGEDEYFQFVIPKAKMQAEQTISMEAEGDPSTFNMSLQVLRPEDGEMIRFIQYAFLDDEDDITSNDSSDKKTDGWLSKAEKDELNKALNGD